MFCLSLSVLNLNKHVVACLGVCPSKASEPLQDENMSVGLNVPTLIGGNNDVPFDNGDVNNDDATNGKSANVDVNNDGISPAKRRDAGDESHNNDSKRKSHTFVVVILKN